MSIIHTLSIASALAFAALGTAQAQTRWVFVNGQRMSDAQVQELARIQCTEIPDGSYWLDTRSGAWGYMGNPTVQGLLGDLCRGVPGINRDGTRGPFATLRRAEEVANQFRSQGLRAVAFHNGDGYYVRVSR